MSHRPEFEAALEAILFVTSEPVTEERLLAVFEESERDEARRGARRRCASATGRAKGAASSSRRSPAACAW